MTKKTDKNITRSQKVINKNKIRYLYIFTRKFTIKNGQPHQIPVGWQNKWNSLTLYYREYKVA